MSTKTTTIYMPLLNEGTDVWRPVIAQHFGSSTFRISPEQPHDTEDEHWQFQLGAVVRCREQMMSDGRCHLVAYELVHASPST